MVQLVEKLYKVLLLIFSSLAPGIEKCQNGAQLNVFSTNVFKSCHLSPVCVYLIVVSHREGNNQMRYVVLVEIELKQQNLHL